MIVFEIFIPSVALLLITNLVLNKSCKKAHAELLKSIKSETGRITGFRGGGV